MSLNLDLSTPTPLEIYSSTPTPKDSIFSRTPIGIAIGIADFTFTIAAVKICELAGTVFVHTDDDGFIPSVLLFPVCEEFFFRDGVQPLVARILKFLVPSSNEKKIYDIPVANIIAAIATGIFFGYVHFDNFEESAGLEFAAICTVTGILFGLTKEYYGINNSIRAHITTNFLASFY